MRDDHFHFMEMSLQDTKQIIFLAIQIALMLGNLNSVEWKTLYLSKKISSNARSSKMGIYLTQDIGDKYS